MKYSWIFAVFLMTSSRTGDFNSKNPALCFLVVTGLCLKCFSDTQGLETARCEERRGFRTCFVKYDQGTLDHKILFEIYLGAKAPQ